MKRKKYVSAGMQLALYEAGGQARKLLKRYVRKKVKQSLSGLFRKPELNTAVKAAAGLTGTKLFANKISRSSEKQKKKRKRRAKVLARALQYALRETRYS